jgi:hypothetical protein
MEREREERERERKRERERERGWCHLKHIHGRLVECLH